MKLRLTLDLSTELDGRCYKNTRFSKQIELADDLDPVWIAEAAEEISDQIIHDFASANSANPHASPTFGSAI